MGQLSDRAMQDYNTEQEIIKEAGGRLWLNWIALAVGLTVMWGLGSLFGPPWTKRDIAEMIIFLIAAPLVGKMWEQFKVAMQMRHQREIRMEAKLDALLGFVKIGKTESDD